MPAIISKSCPSPEQTQQQPPGAPSCRVLATTRSQSSGGGNLSEIVALETGFPLLQPYFFRHPGYHPQIRGLSQKSAQATALGGPEQTGATISPRPIQSRVLRWKRGGSALDPSGFIPQELPGCPSGGGEMAHLIPKAVCLSVCLPSAALHPWDEGREAAGEAVPSTPHPAPQNLGDPGGDSSPSLGKADLQP